MERHCKLCIHEFSKFGFKFQPSDQQICELYLKSIINNKKQQLPCIHLITEEKLYEDYSTPWEIFKNDDSRWLVSSESSNNYVKKIKKTIYVLTALKKKGERVIRKAGCGCWRGQNNNDVVNAEGQVIGSNKLFTFEIKDTMMLTDNSINSYGNWTMHEYCLKPCDNNYALCKITKEEDVVEKPMAADYNPNVSRQLSHGSSNTQDNSQVYSDHIVAITTVPDEIMQLNLENLDEPVPPKPLGDNWESFAEGLDKLLESQEEEENAIHGEVQDSMEESMSIQVSPVLDEEVLNRDNLNQPQLIAIEEEDNIANCNDSYAASRDRFQLPDHIDEMPNDIQELGNVSNDEPIIVEQVQQQNNVHDDRQVLVEQQQQQENSDEISLLDLCKYIASDFNYFYNLQQLQLEELQHTSPGKRKERSYDEDFFDRNSKR